jgi:hypothetical protein
VDKLLFTFIAKSNSFMKQLGSLITPTYYLQNVGLQFLVDIFSVIVINEFCRKNFAAETEIHNIGTLSDSFSSPWL